MAKMPCTIHTTHSQNNTHTLTIYSQYTHNTLTIHSEYNTRTLTIHTHNTHNTLTIYTQFIMRTHYTHIYNVLIINPRHCTSCAKRLTLETQ